VDLSVGTPTTAQDLDRDFLKASPAQPRRKVFDTQLRRMTEHCSQLLKQVLVPSSLRLKLVSKSPQPVYLLTLLFDTLRECAELAAETLIEVPAHAHRSSRHAWQSTSHSGRVPHCDGCQT